MTSILLLSVEMESDPPHHLTYPLLSLRKEHNSSVYYCVLFQRLALYVWIVITVAYVSCALLIVSCVKNGCREDSHKGTNQDATSANPCDANQK
mmetsp:Transcript_24145/g.37228  ORF Transcript_24145/g.37228 Transcript_24145/m.37228 type:complete len:94 (-) Transcript_24145:283-564(-)